MLYRKFLGFLLLSITLTVTGFGQTNDIFQFKNGFALKTSSPYLRDLFAKDPVEYAVATGNWKAPHAGEKVHVGDSVNTWTSVDANAKGWFESKLLEGGYLYAEYNSDKEQTALLKGMAYNMVYVNGAPRIGNKYQTQDTKESWETSFDFSLLPVHLKKGKNTFLFQCSRGKLKAALHLNQNGVFLNTADATLPDLIKGEKPDMMGAVVVINATGKTVKDAFISASSSIGISSRTKIPIIEPISVRKVGFKINGEAPSAKGNITVKLEVFLNNSKKSAADGEVSLRILNPEDNHKCTFISGIDGSVQYYSVNPASDTGKSPKALFLSLHGASVEAINQSGSYYPKSWGYIVSPTNRRPYGFDWEDWGRLDAMEVYNIALKTLNIDRSRIYLTGHSMGGHGTWSIGAIYPDKFGAIGPSAGWISFWSYGIIPEIKDPSPIQKIIMRSYLPIHTDSLLENYKQEGIYIIHGSADDNVPVTEALTMVEHLKKFHHDFMFHEQPGAGHWWDVSDENGADCVDWAPLFDFFSRHARPSEKRILNVDFETACPGVSAKNNWITVEAQQRQLMISRVIIRLDPGKNRFVGTTHNVERLAFDTKVIDPNRAVVIELDGQKLTDSLLDKSAKQIWVGNKNGKWSISGDPGYEVKNQLRCGLFKDAFRHHMIFVYGTKGNKEENKWAFDKARFDAEQFWYQGNGSINVVPDFEFNPASEPDRSVILYGNNQTNSAWNKLIDDSPVQIGEGYVKIGDKTYEGRDLGCLFIRPRKGSNLASVGIVSGSGITGMRLTDRRPYLSSGFQFPDIMLFNEKLPEYGAGGILAAGFFGQDWSVKNGDIVYSK